MRINWLRDMLCLHSDNVGIGRELGIVRGARTSSLKKFMDTDECLYLWPRRCAGRDDGPSKVTDWKLKG